MVRLNHVWLSIWFLSLMEDERDKTANAVAAATLSILGGVGHLYLGIKRGYIFLACSLVMILISQVFWSTGWLIYVQFAIFTAFDAFSFAKRGFGLF